MATFYLNSDKSLMGEILPDGTVFVRSTHKNMKNSQVLVENISKIISVATVGKERVVRLNGVPYVTVNIKTDQVTQVNELTSFETRLLSQGRKDQAVTFQRLATYPKQMKTDLHTHFAGALPPERLISCGLGKGVTFPKWVLETAKIDTKNLIADAKGNFPLESVVANEANRLLLINAMKIDTSEQETFNKMEEIYAVRGPFTKNPNMFIPIVREIALDAQTKGVEYMELSLSSVISDVKQLELLEEHMPAIEKSTGVKIRFLGALWRHSDKEWNMDEVDRLKVTSASPYVVGCDVMGHETNSTMEFYDQIKELAKHAMQHDPDFVIRVHAGENPLFKANVRQVLLAVEEAQYELKTETGKTFDFPQVRLGHGIYGFDEPAPWDEKERTKDVTMEELCAKIKPVIEFNMSSNLSLNNINQLGDIPIKSYLDRGIQVCLGTDGRGIYSTDLKQEMILASQAGITYEDFAKITKTEEAIIARANRRFRSHRKCNLKQVQADLQTCYSGGEPKYNEQVAQKYNMEQAILQSELTGLIAHSGAVTDAKKIEKDLEGKIPVLLTGSSQKHWPKISDANKLSIQVALDALVHAIDSDKAYLVTGGTNHGVEREAHIIANRYNSQEGGKLIVLGTLTEEAAKKETNSIERDTITHAVIPTLNGRPAKRWFDLPDTVLNMVGEKEGTVVAIGGGPIVSDMIQRSHNMGLSMLIMGGVEGASGEKAQSLEGNDYVFSDAKQLVDKLIKANPEVVKEGMTPEKIDALVLDAFKRVTKAKALAEEKATQQTSQKAATKQASTKKLKLTSLDPSKYPDIEIECHVVEDMKGYAEKLIASQKELGITPKKARKTSLVTARIGLVGEEVDTRPRVERDGKVYAMGETKGVVKVAGSMIVKNPDGEEYIVKPEAFSKKYIETENPGVYKPIAEPITYVTLPHDIAFKAPWGEDMYGVKGGVINVSNLDDIYAIQNEAFKKTYTAESTQTSTQS